MNNFYTCAKDHHRTLLVIKDQEGFVFGFFATEDWHKSSSFYGVVIFE